MVCTEKYGNWQVEKKLTAGAMEAQDEVDTASA